VQVVDDPLAQNPVFAQLDKQVRADLYRRCQRKSFASATLVLQEQQSADHVYALLSGSVRVFHSSDTGGEVLLKIFKPPAIFGEMEAIAGLSFLENVRTLEPSELLLIPRDVFIELLEQQNSVAVGVLADLSARFCIATHNEKALAFFDVRTRLASFICSYVAFDGRAVSSGRTFRLGLTQDDMASALAVTRRAIAKEIARWRESGVLERARGRYVVCDLEQLKKEAAPLHLALTYHIGMKLA
jgi:CRP-like cAMP-binding protein